MNKIDKTARGMRRVILVLMLLAPQLVLAADNRQMVVLPTEMQEGILENMRDHLATLLEILKHLSNEDYVKAADTAESRIGLSSPASHSANYMVSLTPKEMHAIGTRMHTAASRFARKTRAGDLDQAHAALGVVTAACVSCHYKYRIR